MPVATVSQRSANLGRRKPLGTRGLEPRYWISVAREQVDLAVLPRRKHADVLGRVERHILGDELAGVQRERDHLEPLSGHPEFPERSHDKPLPLVERERVFPRAVPDGVASSAKRDPGSGW